MTTSNKSRILLQTTIPYKEDDWHIGRFSMLHQLLVSLRDEDGNELYDVVARDREVDDRGNDRVLSSLDKTDFDQLWLFAVDVGDGLSDEDARGITRFWRRGGGIFSSRDHADVGASLFMLPDIGAAHYFHSRNLDPDATRRRRDDPYNLAVDHPNFHSGNNGDFQRVETVGAVHELLLRANGEPIEYLPAHPHEGSVGEIPHKSTSRVIATGTSSATGCKFNLSVAFESAHQSDGVRLGRAIAASSFHQFADYNWDTDLGCPTFVTELPGTGYKDSPRVLDDVKCYASNIAMWLCR